MCVFTSHLFVVICQVRWQNSLTLHASHIWLPKGNAQVEGNTINWLIATYFLFLLTNKLADFLLPINYLQEDGKSNACEVLQLIFLTYIDTLLQCVTKASAVPSKASPSKSITHLQWKCFTFSTLIFSPKCIKNRENTICFSNEKIPDFSREIQVLVEKRNKQKIELFLSLMGNEIPGC